MNRLKDCLYCLGRVEGDSCLQCMDCSKLVHIKCLKRPGTPGDILGDVFFQFRCNYCTDDGLEVFTRTQIPWALLVVLAIHNLSIQSKGLSHHGYFHWRAHIANYIEKNWNFLIGPDIKKKKKWTGTISGTLSHNNPVMFTSGYQLFKETGWWKLTHNYTPKQYMDFFKSQRLTEKRKIVDEEQSDSEVNQTQQFIKLRAAEPEIFSRSIPFMGRPQWNKTTKTSNQSNLDDFLSSNETTSNDDLGNFDTPFANGYSPMMSSATNTENDWPDNFLNLGRVKEEPPYDADDDCQYEPRIVQVTNFQEANDVNDVTDENSEDYSANIKVEADFSDGGYDNVEDHSYNYHCEKSLFNVTDKRPLPWLNEVEANEASTSTHEHIEHMGKYDESEILHKLRSIMNSSLDMNSSMIPSWIRRYYRKLCLREVKRKLGKPLFDINAPNGISIDRNDEAHILDRYHHLICVSTSRIADKTNVSLSFQSRLAGAVQYDLFESPHTGRRLHPFIYRNSKTFPLWIKLMCELQYTVTGEKPSRAPIDYCYVRPHHIAAVNSLLQNHFWPGIDMSECLSYPDFSIVALYKKLVVGCAFLVPDVGHNVAYVSFMAVRNGWQRSGIASFMLYHLTQTCMGKDITLHVSASNPAICLYQKFGFKIEEVILDFYEKYLPFDSKQSRNAFFLRLKR